MKILVMEFTFSGARRGVHIINALRRFGNVIYYLTNVPVSRKPVGELFNLEAVDRDYFLIEVPNPRRHLPWKGVGMRAVIQLINTLLFFVAIVRNLSVLRQVDIIISRGMHPFTEPPAIFLKRVSGATLYLDVCDPLSEAVDVLVSNRVLIFLLKVVGVMVNKTIYAVSDGLMTHTKSMVKIISKYTTKTVHPIYNAVDTETFRPIDKAVAKKALTGVLPVEELEGKFVILYSGLIGPSQDLGRVLDTAKLLSDDVVFVLIGAGEERDMLERRVREEGIRNVVFWPYVPWKLMPYVVNLADVCLLPLRGHPVYFVALPKKFFEYVACGKPVICFCPRGEATSLVEEWRAGVAVDPDDIEGLAEAVRSLSMNRKLVLEMGRNARRMAESLFSLERIGRQLNSLLEEALAERGRLVRASS